MSTDSKAGSSNDNSPSRTVYTLGLSIRVRPRTSVFAGVATGRYWTRGLSRTEWHSDARLPFAQAGVVRFLPSRPYRVRVTFMGWRGADHAPAPSPREWFWPRVENAPSVPFDGTSIGTPE